MAKSLTEQGKTKTYTKKEVNQKKFLDIFTEKATNIKQTCAAIGISRSRYYEWYKEDIFKSKVDDIVEGLIDDVESQLYMNIMDGKESSIFFFLKTRAKHRGYIERQETEISGGITHDELEVKFI